MNMRIFRSALGCAEITYRCSSAPRDLTARGSFSDNFLLEGLTYSLPLAANDARNLVMRELEKGNCFVLLDGLDELLDRNLQLE